MNTNKYFTFSEALYELKNNKSLSRNEWDNKYKFIFRQVPCEIDKDIIPKMQSIPDSAKQLLNKNVYSINYKNQIAMVKDSTGTIISYLPSADDLLAEDWFILK